MKTHVLLLLFACTVIAGNAIAQECSTEIANDNCTITVDHAYPVTLPTIQMRPGATITVNVVDAFPFEILSLDPQTTQAAAGTDQLANFITTALPNLKSLVIQTKTETAPNARVKRQMDAVDTALTSAQASAAASPNAKAKFDQLVTDMKSVKAQIELYPNVVSAFLKTATTIYAHLNEVIAPIVPDAIANQRRLPSSSVASNFPLPWVPANFELWRNSLLCEIGGAHCDEGVDPTFDVTTAAIRQASALTTALGACPNAAHPDQASQDIVACKVALIQNRISASTGDQIQVYNVALPDSDKVALFKLLADLQAAESIIVNIDTATIVNVSKDLGSYYANIEGARSFPPSQPLGQILDPYASGIRNTNLNKSLGRQATFVVDAVNEIATSTTSITPSTQRKPIASIIVLFADPIFEVSAGAFFSSLPNRSFANQTLVTQSPGASPIPGNVVIAQTISHPTIVPFVAANWRLGPDFLWSGKRRKAFYATVAVGLNTNNSTAEFGVGPSFSWRSVMFSPLLHIGHDYRLTQGEFVGQVWCNQTAVQGSIPKCSGNPPSPTSERYWTEAFGFGISIRVPSVFGGGH
jgi:hypothetical protein